jgi:hypothetical protein
MKLGLLFFSLTLALPSLVGCASPGSSARATTSALSSAAQPSAAPPPPAAPSAVAVVAQAPSASPRVEVAPARATALRVSRFVIARGVEAREPIGVDTSFGKDEKRVFAFVEVQNGERAPGELKVQFVAPDGRAETPVDLSVGDSPRFRTWAFTRQAHAPGLWKALVKSDKGRVIAQTVFEVKA